MNKMDITPILELAVKLIFTLITIFLVPKLKELISTKVAESDQKKHHAGSDRLHCLGAF